MRAQTTHNCYAMVVLSSDWAVEHPILHSIGESSAVKCELKECGEMFANNCTALRLQWLAFRTDTRILSTGSGARLTIVSVHRVNRFQCVTNKYSEYSSSSAVDWRVPHITHQSVPHSIAPVLCCTASVVKSHASALIIEGFIVFCDCALKEELAIN